LVIGIVGLKASWQTQSTARPPPQRWRAKLLYLQGRRAGRKLNSAVVDAATTSVEISIGLIGLRRVAGL
jgi:hypothetical protein